jgi:hypothetical protein
MTALPTTRRCARIDTELHCLSTANILHPVVIGRQWRSSSGCHDKCHPVVPQEVKRSESQKVTRIWVYGRDLLPLNWAAPGVSGRRISQYFGNSNLQLLSVILTLLPRI